MFKKLFSFVLCIAMLASMVSFSLAEEATPSWKLDTTPVTLKVYYDRPIDAAVIVETWGKEPVSQKWIADTNVNVEWDYAVDESHSKLNMMIAGGDYPDIVIVKRDWDMLNDLVENNVIVKYNELQESCAPGFVDRIFGENMILNVRETYDTMDLYVLPTLSYTPERMAGEYVQSCVTGIMVLKNVYESIGSPDMTTIDGVLAAFRKVKEMYPEMIPFQASRNPSGDGDGNPRCICQLLQYFGMPANYYLDETTGTYRKYWYNEKFYQLLTFVNTMYNEGLMDPTELTDSGEQLRAKLFNGQVFCNFNNDANNIDWFNTELANAGINDEWIFPAQPSTEPEGYTYDNIMGGVGDHCVIIFDTPNKQRALQWLDYVMQDQAQMEIVCGIEGISWNYNEKGIPAVYPEINALSSDEKRVSYGIGLYHPLRMGGYRDAIDIASGTEAQTEAILSMNKYYKDYSFAASAKPEKFSADSEEIKIKTNITEYWSTQILQLITCKPEELEAKFQESMARVQALGQEKIDAAIAQYFVNKEDIIKKFGADLDLSFMGF